MLVFVLLAVVHTWPLTTDPSHLSRVDSADGSLNIWAIGWVAHALTHHPSQLFDANTFYPERGTLAFSESMIVQGVMAIPVIAAGGSVVLAYNLVLLTGFVLTGLAFCLLVWRWTGSWSAGLIAGSLAAFNAHVLVRMTHMQTQHPEFIAVMLFALDRLLSSKRTRDALLLGGAFALHGLTSIYLLVFSIWLLIFAVGARAVEWLRAGAGAIVRLALAGILGALLLSPYLYAYWRVHAADGFERGVADEYSGSLADYLATAGRVHAWWSTPYGRQAASYAFPGVIALGLVACALVFRETRRDPRVRMSLVAAIGCIAVSLAPRLPFYPLLHRAIPMFWIVRVQSHIAQIVLLMVAIVAGYGVAAIQRRISNPRMWAAAASVLFVLVNVEVLRAPVGWARFNGIPPAYDALITEQGAVIVELPFPLPSQWFLSTPYMLNSTRHWKPMLNGYSGFRPPSYLRSYDAVAKFPADESLIALHALGVTHVVLHRSAVGQAVFDAAKKQGTLYRVANDDDVYIFRLQPP